MPICKHHLTCYSYSHDSDDYYAARGSVYKYKCDRGFRMHGSSLLTCTGWSLVDDMNQKQYQISQYQYQYQISKLLKMI